MSSMMPMPEEEPEKNQEQEFIQAQEGSYNYQPEYEAQYEYEATAAPAEDNEHERAVAESIRRTASLVRGHLRGGPNSYGLWPREAIVNILKTQFQEHAGDLIASLARALDDFDQYRELDQVPLLFSGDWDSPPAPVSIRTVRRRLEAAGLLNHEEAITSPKSLQNVLGNWSALDDAFDVRTVEEASDALYENLETFMTNRHGGIRIWEKGEVAERVPARGIETHDDFDEPTSSNIDTGLFRVTVKCNAPGYRILVSPAYFIDWAYFGSPSTPVTREMLPGRYIFGTDSIGGTVISDKLVFRIPNDFAPEIKRF
jgi:hypothetical protein